MTEARFMLTIPALRHDAANELASALEEDFRLDPLAITINETDEALGLWEIALYFATEEEAAEARGIKGLAHGAIAPMPEEDWVRLQMSGICSLFSVCMHTYYLSMCTTAVARSVYHAYLL